MIRQYRRLVFVCLGILIGGYSVASFAAFTSYQGSAFRNINGTMYWKGDAGTLAASQARVIESVNVGGKYVGVPHVGALGAAALEAAIFGIKRTPLGFVGSLALGHLASKGIQLIDDQWMSLPPDQPVNESEWNGYWSDSAGGYKASSWEASAQAYFAATKPGFVFHIVQDYGSYVNVYYTNGVDSYPSNTFYKHMGACSGNQVWRNGSCQDRCPSGYIYTDNVCRGDALQPAGESDWARVREEMPPDAVMKDLCSRLAAIGGTSYGCPVTNPKVEATMVPLSEWVQDPNTGKWSRTVAKVSGAPTAEDPYRKQVDVQVETQDRPTTTNEQGQTVDTETGEVIPTPTKTTEQDKEFCTLHPEALACWEQGEPEDIDLGENTKNITIAPDSGWGASGATCPADLTYTTHQGIQVKYSWQPVCQMANTFRPIVIGFAWLSAVLIFLGISRKAT